MKNNKNHVLVLIAAILVFSISLTACKSESSYARYNEGVSVGNLRQSVLDAFPVEPGSALEWLRDNLDSIRRNLLEKNYEDAVSILLEKKDELTDNEYYNALLYIAYMGSGDEASANALLENKKLNEEIFIQCVVECASILSSNEEIQAIMEQLVPPETEPTQKPRPVYIPEPTQPTNSSDGNSGSGGNNRPGGNDTGGNDTGGNGTGGNETGGNETGGNDTGGNDTVENDTGGSGTDGNGAG